MIKLHKTFAMKYFFINLCLTSTLYADQFNDKIKPFLNKYCTECHGGRKVKAHVNFKTIADMKGAYKQHELWADVLEVMQDKDMPPEDEKQPTAAELKMYSNWYTKQFVNIKARPGKAQMRRLSTEEYNNSLKSLLGFEMHVIGQGNETVSLAIKVLPQDPPGESGFSNDTSQTPMNETHWEKYNYLANRAVEDLFSPAYREKLQAFSGPINGKFSIANTKKTLTHFISKAFKSINAKTEIKMSLARVAKEYKSGKSLELSTKKELKGILLSPQFLYVGKYNPARKGAQVVSNDELAQRLSYFLWGTLPDTELLKLAAAKKLLNKATILKQVDRMLKDPRSKTFTSTFVRQWLSLDEILKLKTDKGLKDALYQQPLHFFDDLVRNNRPLMEVVDSQMTYANENIYNFYDSKDTNYKAPKKRKSPGVLPLKKMTLANTPYRGGLLTMPGILRMYSGNEVTNPILRGIWVLENIFGDELPEAPDVPAIKRPKKGAKLTFRQVFEQHTSSPSCAICHDKIDPLGFGLENYDYLGAYRPSGKGVDSSGKTPRGDKFENFAGLKKLLVSKHKKDITHAITEKMFAYAMARKLEAYDKPIIDKIAAKMYSKGTFHSLIREIVLSQSFTQTYVE
ncbi:MAG: DUF1592 domain-containing protein [Lentisphaerales bacterium]|nr:DUF1592 domain-containing protein [Lentisphaerales bacterium]